MGFLDHSTNNIIVDAVLTDYGRKKLAEAAPNGEIITSYGFADDEVDYTMIKKYGLIVGKEKIEKNTPVFEASTNAEYGVEYYLFTTTTPLLPMSTVSISSVNSDSPNVLSNEVVTQPYQVSLALDGTNPADPVVFTLSYDKRFLTLMTTGAFTAGTEHGTNPNRLVAKTNSPVTTASFSFQKSSTAGTILQQRNVTSVMSQFTITSDNGHIVHQTIEVSS